jgi:flagellin FlaB
MRVWLLRGIVGIEAAIVLIAFVVVATALAFVVLNMGFYTTQRSKEVMGQGLAQASSALEIDGTVLAKVSGTVSLFAQ